VAGWQLYGARGWGSTLAEGMLAWAGEPCDFVDVSGFDRPGPAREQLLRVNPLARVPTLIDPHGRHWTESAALAVFLVDLHPERGLGPPIGDPLRPAFLNRLIWFVAVLYPTFTYRDYPERWAPSASEELVERVDTFRKSLWQQLEEQSNSLWLLGDRPSLLDLYVAVMSHWRPRRTWLAEHCPKLIDIAQQADAHPPISRVLERNFAG
jgi:GST-like protein